MNNFITNNFFPLFVVMLFLALVLLIEGLYMMWDSYKGSEAKKIGQRLRLLSAGAGDSERTLVLKNRMLSGVPVIERLLLRIPRIHELDRFLVQSGLNVTAGKLLLLSFFCAASSYIVLAWLRMQSLFFLCVALSTAFLPFAYIQWKRDKRLRKIEQQLPDALDLIGRALRSGHALPSSLLMAAEEMTAPIGLEFRTTHEEINFGVAMQQALMNLSERVPISDLRYFVVAVLIQREAGGNLSEVLDNLSKLIRNRIKFRSKVKLLTTEGRMSAWIMGLLPFALAGLFNIANHEFISVLWTDPIGIKISKIVLTIMAIGGFWLYRLIQIRV